MNTEVVTTIGAVLTLVVNYTSSFIVFPCRHSLRVSIAISAVYVTATFVLFYFLDMLGVTLGGWRGLIHLPIVIYLFKSDIFQKIFYFFLAMTLTGFFWFLSDMIAQSILPQQSERYFWVLTVIRLVLIAVYIAALVIWGRGIIKKLFISSQNNVWALYSLGALLTYAILSYASGILSGGARIAVILFAIWGIFLLCFAIINTHAKAMHKYEADTARDIISSGSSYYKKLNELQDGLHILRHDYKYHLNTIAELLASGQASETERYLDEVQKQFSKSDIQGFCSNAVINALISSYAERCAKLSIAFSASIVLPDTMSIPNYEMCIVLGNLLENAVEACKKQVNTKEVVVTVNTRGDNIAVMVKNSYNGEINKDGDLFISTKTDGGLGLRSVQAVAARYGGKLMTERDDNTFSAYALMRR